MRRKAVFLLFVLLGTAAFADPTLVPFTNAHVAIANQANKDGRIHSDYTDLRLLLEMGYTGYALMDQGEMVGFSLAQKSGPHLLVNELHALKKGIDLRPLLEKLKEDVRAEPELRTIRLVNQENIVPEDAGFTQFIKKNGSYYWREDGKATALVRPMKSRDMPSVLALENKVFPDSPWSREDFEESLEGNNSKGFVVETSDGRVAGYMMVEFTDNKIRLLSIAVNPEHQREGIGLQMIEGLKANLSPEGRNKIVLEVREGNVDAQKFFRDQGFHFTATLPDFYEDSDEVAYGFIHRKTEDTPHAKVLRGQNFFERLGVTVEALDEEIESAYQKLRKYADKETHALLEEARRTLTDPKERETYLKANKEAFDHLGPAITRKVFSRDSNPYNRIGAHPGMKPERIARLADTTLALFGKNPTDRKYILQAKEILLDQAKRNQLDAILATTEKMDQERALKRFLKPQREEKPKRRKLPKLADIPLSSAQKVMEPDPQSERLYQRLGLAENAHVDTLKGAFEATLEKFKGQKKNLRLITEAYRVLQDPLLRKAYDSLSQNEHPGHKKKIRELIAQAPLLGEPPVRQVFFGEFLPKADPTSANLFTRLGLEPNASEDAIFEAYRRTLRRYQNDPMTQKAIVEAFRVLTDEPYRAIHKEAALSGRDVTENTRVLIELASKAHEAGRKIREEEWAKPGYINLYEKLGAHRYSTRKQIDKAYKKRVKKAQTPEEVEELHKTWRLLTDKQSREAYDRIIDSPHEALREADIVDIQTSLDERIARKKLYNALNLWGPNASLDMLIEAAGEELKSLRSTHNPKTFKNFFDRIEDRLQEETFDNLRDHEMTVRYLESLFSAIPRTLPDSDEPNDLYERAVEIRTRLNESLLKQGVHTRADLNLLISFYAPDFRDVLVQQMKLIEEKLPPENEPLKEDSLNALIRACLNPKKN